MIFLYHGHGMTHTEPALMPTITQPATCKQPILCGNLQAATLISAPIRHALLRRTTTPSPRPPGQPHRPNRITHHEYPVRIPPEILHHSRGAHTRFWRRKGRGENYHHGCLGRTDRLGRRASARALMFHFQFLSSSSLSCFFFSTFASNV